MPMIYAHRGASGYAPENTLRAFALAADMHADGVELDVQRTRDGVLVVFHDETVDRVTGGHGFIADMTLAEVKRLRVCRPFPDQPEEIPTLEEVFALLKSRGLRCNAELKNSFLPYPGMEAEVLDLASKMGMTDAMLYSSFQHHSMARVKQLDPAARTGLLYAATLVRPWDYAKSIGADALHPEFTEILQIREEVERAHALGIEVNPWTVNEESHLRAMIAAGCDRIITNYPDHALALLP